MTEITNCSNHNKRLCVGNNKPIESQWQCHLPIDVAFLILDKLFEPADHLCFSIVCKEWQSFSRDHNKAKTHDFLLPLFWNTSDEKLLSISNEKRYNKICVPRTCSTMICCGSSHGWLARVEHVGRTMAITLVYPFRESVAPISLPPLDFLTCYNMIDLSPDCVDYKKHIPYVVTLSADPNLHPDDYHVMVLYHYYHNMLLAFTKGGQRKSWVFLDRRLRNLQDVTFYKDQIFAVGLRGRIVSFDVNAAGRKRPNAKRLTPRSPFKTYSHNSYLVKSSKDDHLWHVRRLVSGGLRSFRERFVVYKVVFDIENGGVEQVEVEGIGDEALFLGGGDSVSVLASNFPGCKRNCIYYTNYDGPSSQEQYQIISLEDDCVKKHHKYPGHGRQLEGGAWIQFSSFFHS